MHYKINDCIIKTEYAATSTQKPNCVVLDLIKLYAPGTDALDYGCGKLRHTIPLCGYAKSVIAVDSEEQIRRNQCICGKRATILDYAEKYLPTLSVYKLDDNDWKNRTYGFILCTNVLSAVPCKSERLCILKRIKQLLAKEGIALISVQFRNSYYKTYAARMNTHAYEDGWIISSCNRYSFYGIIHPNSLHKLFSDSGLRLLHQRIIDGSVYCIVH